MAQRGALRFDRFMDLALYHPDLGFYATAGGPGRQGHFLTSPEVGPLFAEVIARAMDRWWRDLGRPDPFVVVEAGAGPGTLAAGILAAGPDCLGALRYVLVDRMARWRSEQVRRLPLDQPTELLGSSHSGPVFVSVTDMPAGPLVGVVLANELVDNLAVRILELGRQGDGRPRWHEIYRAPDGTELAVPADAQTGARAARLAPGAGVGARLALAEEAVSWLSGALALLERGRVVVIDYGDRSSSLAARPWTEWLRTYRAHGRGSHPLADPGSQDITCEMAMDQLSEMRRPTSVRTQREFLVDHGLDDLLDRAGEQWRAAAAAPDLAALAARSRQGEGRALTDPDGLGAFWVMEWEVPRPA